MSDCPICVNSYNKSTRALITCSNCDLECCKVCFKRYISDPDHYLRCMGCSVEFDRTMLNTRLGQTFMRTTFRDIRENMLYENEKALFPATQEVVEREQLLSKLRDRRDGLDHEYEQIRRNRTVPLREFRHSLETMAVRDALDRYLQLQLTVESVDEQLNDSRRQISSQISDLEGNATKLKRTYVLGCTKADCKGMLSSENTNTSGNYVCSICESTTCSDCKMGIDGNKHECDPDVLKTVQYMESTSKPCPACGIPIHKVSGCFSAGTIIPLANGTNITAIDVEPNHVLIGDDGTERTVLSVTTGEDQMYMIHQSNGCSYEVNTYHTLCLMREDGRIVLMTLNVYLDLPNEERSKLFGYKFANGVPIMSKLEVVKTTIAKYYGFQITDNKRFLLQDGTVVHNCSQMFCTGCHASFDWNTMRLNTGNVHNPHHAEWLRANKNRPREIGDIQCGRELSMRIAVDTIDALDVALDRVKDWDTKEELRSKATYIFEAMRVCIHHHHVTIVSLNRNRHGHFTNQRLRINLLTNAITELEFKREIQKRDKATSKRNDLLHVVMTYRDALTDIIWPFVDAQQRRQIKSLDEWKSMAEQIKALEDYVNECFVRVSETYGTVAPFQIMADRAVR